MPTLRKDIAFVTHFIGNLRGGSQPILAEASDGLQYVVKFANNPQGPNVLFNESVGSELFRAFGLPGPKWTPLRISDSFLGKNSEFWMQTTEGRRRPTSGLCFGSRFLGGGGKRILEILPGSSFGRVRNLTKFWMVWLIDVCAEHADNRQAVFEEESDGWLNAYFVDHGHLFGGPKAELEGSFSASRYLDPRIYPVLSSKSLADFQIAIRAMDADRLWQRTKSIPDEWVEKSALNKFENCLQRLSIPLYTQSLLSTIVGSLERRATTETDRRGY
jgi:hypothetical protein